LLARHADQELGGELVDELGGVAILPELQLELGSELRPAVYAELLFALERRRTVADFIDRPRDGHRRALGKLGRASLRELLRQFGGKIRYVASACLFGHV